MTSSPSHTLILMQRNYLGSLTFYVDSQNGHAPKSNAKNFDFFRGPLHRRHKKESRMAVTT
jgi:hypothetical protein